MIIWRGYGIVVIILTIVGLAIARALAERFWGVPLSEDIEKWSQFVGMLLAAAGVYGVHLLVEKTEPPQVVIDKVSGQELQLKPKNDLFFVPLEYWAYVLAAVGVFLAFR